MGGERTSTAWQTKTRRLYMRFERCQRWRVSFLDRSDPRAQFRELTFADRHKLEQMVARTPTRMILEDKQAFELALLHERGAIDLTFTEEQYKKLRR